jgi:hypothetical protein
MLIFQAQRRSPLNYLSRVIGFERLVLGEGGADTAGLKPKRLGRVMQHPLGLLRITRDRA